jgi:uncharacterized protein YndB with AHSA1/START domain
MSKAQPIVVERSYKATLSEIWELWTTKEGFESWWGPEGFRVEVHELDARVGGKLNYDMIAHTPEAIEAMKLHGQPLSHATHGTFSALEQNRYLKLTHVIDFLPGVVPYESVIEVDLVAKGDSVRMIVKLHAMHTPEFSQMQKEGFTSQLTKLDKRFAAGA